MDRLFKGFLFFALATSFLFSGLSPAIAQLSFESGYDIKQLGNVDFEPSVRFGGSLEQSYTTDISQYNFDLEAFGDDLFQLKAKSSFDMSIDHRENEITWNSVEVNSFTHTSMTDIAFVEGLDGQVGGIVELHWLVTGFSDLEVDARGPNAVMVNKLNNLATLSSSQDIAGPDIFIHDEGNQLLGNSLFADTKVAVLQPQVFAVEWFANQPIDIFFELDVRSNLMVTNFDAAGFSAELNGDFTNTATMLYAAVYDMEGNFLPGANLVGQGGTLEYRNSAVPEPTQALSLLLGLAAVSFRRTRKAQTSN